MEGGCKEYHEDIDDVISDITHSGVVRWVYNVCTRLHASLMVDGLLHYI